MGDRGSHWRRLIMRVIVIKNSITVTGQKETIQLNSIGCMYFNKVYERHIKDKKNNKMNK